MTGTPTTGEIALQKWRFQCAECGTEFEEFDIDELDAQEGGIDSGRTPSGEFAVLSEKADPAWVGIGTQIYHAVEAAGLSSFGSGDALGFVTDPLLDPSSSGETFALGRSPRCPRSHGFMPVILVGPVRPIEVRKQTVPLLGHAKWDAMDEAERRAFIERRIADYRLVEAERRRRKEDLVARSDKWPQKPPVSG
jgi:hypothetical protein